MFIYLFVCKNDMIFIKFLRYGNLSNALKEQWEQQLDKGSKRVKMHLLAWNELHGVLPFGVGFDTTYLNN